MACVPDRDKDETRKLQGVRKRDLVPPYRAPTMKHAQPT
jgi:hypothetical protein